jgi:fructose-1-phosphate kinase PfkB-like protein
MTVLTPRIWEITPNPAIDYCRLAGLSAVISLGGGGNNGARSIGCGTIATGFAGTGTPDGELFNMLKIHGVTTRFVLVDSPTRIMIFDPGNGGKAQRQLIRPGFEVTRSDLNRLLEVLCDPVGGVLEDEPVIFSGSVPEPLNGGTYAFMAEQLLLRKPRFVLDGPADAIRNAIKYAWVVKQNLREFRRLVGADVNGDPDTLFEICRTLFPKVIMIVTLGPDGTFFGFPEDGRYHGLHLLCDLPETLPLVNRLGSGDVATAQFAWELALSNDVRSAASWAAGAATASLANPYPGVFDPILAGELRPFHYSYNRSELLARA